MEHKCRDCRLFNSKDKLCEVVVYTADSQKLQIATCVSDECHWERVEREINKELGTAIAHEANVYFRAKLIDEYTSPIEVKQIRMWNENGNGYIEAPLN